MNIYDKVPVKVQKKSGFDKSFQNLFTSKVGTITPILTDELIPNTTVNLKMAISTQLPPLASDTFMRVKQKYAAFFVPTRLLVSDYEKWLTGNKGTVGSEKYIPVMPEYRWQPSKDYDHFKPGSLADYLGYKVVEKTPAQISSVTATTRVCALPFLAYHRIYNDWFRNSLVQKDIYADTVGSSIACASMSTRHFWNGSTNSQYMTAGLGTTQNTAHSDLFNDGVRLWELRQANFGSDIFTSCTPNPQNGEAQSVSFAMPENAGDDGSFTISALRAANSMQQFLERNNLAGNRLVDYVKAQYGANLSDSIAQRPILLGAGSFDVYSKGIYQTNMSTDGSSVSSNPFATSTAARFGSAYVDGQDLIIKGFTAQEPGYLMVVTWLSPKVTYSTGLDPMLDRYLGYNSQSDMANPILQNVGNEPIYVKQLDSRFAYTNTVNTVFGYNDRYANWKDKQDEVHGILRDDSSLQAFALQRTFDNDGVANPAPAINSSFLQIPTNYLDQIASVSTDISNYGYWSDTYFDYKVSMPLARYSIPSLQDPAYEHGDDIIIDRSGRQLS